MKHKIFKTLIAVVVATMTFCAEADTETVNGIKWHYTVKNGEASLERKESLKIRGFYYAAIPESTSGAITIPSTLGGYPVTSIGEKAFEGCSSLTSVTIPNSVTSIGDLAFFGCSSLTSVTIPESVTSIGKFAFFGCSSLTSVTIPNSVTSIGDYAFQWCKSLKSVTIPERVTSIGDCAFRGCSSLTSVTIPNSVTSIGECAFFWCSSLKCVTILSSVTSIGREAIPYNCKFITPVGNGDKVDKMVKKGEYIVEEALTEQKMAELYDSFQTLFGKRIGDKISPYEIERNFYKNGKFHKEYVFTPRKPFLSFNRYIVKVSAQNHVIYSIRATAEYSPELYKMVKDAIEKKYQVWLHRWPSEGKVKEDRYVWGVKGSLERLFNLQVIDNGDAGKEIVLEILDKQIEKTVESESFMDAVDAL